MVVSSSPFGAKGKIDQSRNGILDAGQVSLHAEGEGVFTVNLYYDDTYATTGNDGSTHGWIYQMLFMDMPLVVTGFGGGTMTQRAYVMMNFEMFNQPTEDYAGGESYGLSVLTFKAGLSTPYPCDSSTTAWELRPTPKPVNCTPSSGTAGTTMNVTISGKYFLRAGPNATGASIAFGPGITVNSWSLKNSSPIDNEIIANITINSTATPGGRDVNVTSCFSYNQTRVGYESGVLAGGFTVSGGVEQYNLTINVTPSVGGNVTVNGTTPTSYPNTTTWNYGDVVTLNATAASGYNFVNWTGNVSTIANVTAANTTINMTGNYSICANFAINQYNLTISSSDGGNVTTPGEGTFTYNYGTVVSLVATADANYHFVNWTGDVGTVGNVSAATTNITMNGNYSIVANFAINRYNLSTSSTSGGNVTTPGEGTFTYNYGTVVNLAATADANYHFVNWTGEVSTVGNVSAATTNITMNGNYSIVANFAINRYNLTVNVTPSVGGNVTVNGQIPTGYPNTTTWNNGDVVTLNAAAASGYNFVNWTGNLTGSTNPKNITMNSNNSVTANFAEGIGATLEGHVSFPGRGSNNTKWVEPFNVTLFEAGNLSHVLWTGDATTNYTGVFNITGLAPGIYDIGIKNWTCLSEVNTSVTLTAGNTTVEDFGTTREGDSNNDDIITGADRSLLYSGWGQSEGEGGYNAHYDFNRDGSLTGADRSLMYAYWAQSGEA